MQNEELIKALREDAEWVHANEWETPITLGDHLDAAADRLEAADKRVKELETIVTNAEKCDFENRTDCDYCENIQRAVIRIAELEAAQRWISVEERLPEEYEEECEVLTLDVHGGVEGFTASHIPVWNEHHPSHKITHWQPLPQPPEKGE